MLCWNVIVVIKGGYTTAGKQMKRSEIITIRKQHAAGYRISELAEAYSYSAISNLVSALMH